MHGRSDLAPEARHLLFAANRYERREELTGWLAAGATVVADRYGASGIAYGMALGLERAWLESLEARLPPAGLTVLLDADAAASRRRKTAGADDYERDTELLRRCRAAYRELSAGSGWLVVDAHLAVDEVHRRVLAAALAAV